MGGAAGGGGSSTSISGGCSPLSSITTNVNPLAMGAGGPSGQGHAPLPMHFRDRSDPSSLISNSAIASLQYTDMGNSDKPFIQHAQHSRYLLIAPNFAIYIIIKTQ